ncbi:MAG: cyclase family protein [Halobacteriota archaeon]
MTSERFPRSSALEGKDIIDLSSEIYEGMPVYPSHQGTALFKAKTHEMTRARYGEGALTTTTLGVLMSDHGPTHTDAMHHFDSSEDAETIDEMPLHMFYTNAVCADVSDLITSKDDYLTEEQLRERLDADDLTVDTGDTVLLYTGHWNRCWDTDDWLYDYGGLTREATEWLADQGVVNIGIDAPSVDSAAEMARRERNAEDHYPSHQVCKERGVTNTENMTNLDKVAGKSFLYIGLPLNIREGTGSPVRSVAIVDAE